MARPSAEERFWAKVDKGDGTGCWIWTGAKIGAGYGYFGFEGKSRRVHRLAYQWLVGPIPDGCPLDHVKANGCTSTLCVKAIADEYGPTHLEAVTHQENNRRSDSPSARRARQTHCKRGHPFTRGNTYVTRRGFRQCRTCLRDRTRARLAKQLATRAARTHCAHGHLWPGGDGRTCPACMARRVETGSGRKTHCKRGHELSGANLYRQPSNPSHRACRRCWTERRS